MAAVAAFGMVLGLCAVAGPASAAPAAPAGGGAVQKICHAPAPSSVLSTMPNAATAAITRGPRRRSFIGPG